MKIYICGLFAVWVGLSASMASSPPNIVLMMADDQGWGETGYYGHPQVRTPVLDEMAASGLRLDRFYSASPDCTPTRVSVMTGRHANRSGGFTPNWSTRPEEITIAQVLQGAGYATAHYGKWHIGAVKAESPVNPNRMGFDEYLSHDNYFEMDPLLSRNGAPPEVIKGESSETLMKEAIAFAKKSVAKQEPFFIVVWFGSPHRPYSGLPEDLALYEKVSKADLRARFAEITAMDRSIGWFRDAIRELGVADHTLVWFNSDNGIPKVHPEEDSWNGGWRGYKGDLYEGGIRVPAVIEWPAVVREPRTTDVACVTTDIMPTLLDVLGLEHPDPARPCDGISLKPLLVENTMTERSKPIGFWKYPAPREKKNPRWIKEELARGTTPTPGRPEGIDFRNHRHPEPVTDNFIGAAAWMNNRYKLVVPRAKGGKAPVPQLYDLLDDPKEKTDVSDSRPEVVGRMLVELREWQSSVEGSLTGADY